MPQAGRKYYREGQLRQSMVTGQCKNSKKLPMGIIERFGELNFQSYNLGDFDSCLKPVANTTERGN